MSIIYGLKYMNYIGDELNIYRLTKFSNENKMTLTNEKSGEKVTVTKSDLTDKYVLLAPDAFMNIFVTDKNTSTKDVYVCVQKPESKEPELIARQVFYAVSGQYMDNMSNILVGDCVTNVSNPTNQSLVDLMMEFKSIDYSISLGIYVDDSLDDIFACIPKSSIQKMDAELLDIKTNLGNTMTEGYTSTLREFLENVCFISRFHEIFNIGSIDWPIDLGKESYNAEGDIILNAKQKQRLEEYLRQYITDIHVIKYDKDIDISKTITTTHVIVADSTNTIYLISFLKTGDFPVDDDIARAFNIVQ